MGGGVGPVLFGLGGGIVVRCSCREPHASSAHCKPGLVGMAAGAIGAAVASLRDKVRRDMSREEVLQLYAAMWPFEGCHYLAGELELANGQVMVMVISEDSSASEALCFGPWLRDAGSVARGPLGGV